VCPDAQINVDSGYQGIAAWHANSAVPFKKGKNRPLTEEEKASNRQLARERIAIEHGNREIKTFKIMSDRYRNRRRRHGLRMNRICAIAFFFCLLFFAASVVAIVKKNGELTLYQVSRVAAVELVPCHDVFHLLMMNAYYQERNALATFCHRRTKRKRTLKRGIDVEKLHRCKWI